MAEKGETPLILVTNDDGIDSPGLIAAVESVIGLGTVVVVAPTTQQTSRGRSMVGDPDDHLRRVELHGRSNRPHPDGEDPLAEIEAYHIDASPALAVQHAMNTLFHQRWPDLLVSGINYGENLGMDITISGTLGAAFQAAAYGIPAIAVSQASDIANHYEYGEMDWEGATRVVRKHALTMLRRIEGLPPPSARAGSRRLAQPRLFPFDILKIDVPRECPAGTDELVTRLSRRHYFRHTIDNPRRDSRIHEGRTWVDEDPQLIAPGTDIEVVAFRKSVSITPLTVDCTAGVEETAEILGLETSG
ncbi:MAG: 5'/3'-nucleotidase SurE [Spirochaetaceae bacterium]